jgi:YVTN family beta-propeller protein
MLKLTTLSNKRIKDIPVESPGWMAVTDASRNKIYVVSGKNFDSYVSVIDGTTNNKVKDIRLGWGLGSKHIAVGKQIYVANYASGTVSVIDQYNNSKMKIIPVGEAPEDIAVYSSRGTPYYNNNIVYVANDLSDTVSVIDGTTNKRIKDISVGRSPVHIAVNNDNHMIYVSNLGSNTVSVIDAHTNNKVKDIPVGRSPESIAITRYGKTVYVANRDDHTVSVIDAHTNNKVKDIPVGESSINYMAVNEKTNIIYLVDANDVNVIDGNKNEVAAGVTFNIKPAESGRVIIWKLRQINTCICGFTQNA